MTTFRKLSVDDSHGQKTNPGNSDELSESFLQQFQNVLALLNTALQKLTNTKVEKIHCQTQGDSYFEEIQNETQRLIQDLQFLHERVNNPQISEYELLIVIRDCLQWILPEYDISFNKKKKKPQNIKPENNLFDKQRNESSDDYFDKILSLQVSQENKDVQGKYLLAMIFTFFENSCREEFFIDRRSRGEQDKRPIDGAFLHENDWFFVEVKTKKPNKSNKTSYQFKYDNKEDQLLYFLFFWKPKPKPLKKTSTVRDLLWNLTRFIVIDTDQLKTLGYEPTRNILDSGKKVPNFTINLMKINNEKKTLTSSKRGSNASVTPVFISDNFSFLESLKEKNIDNFKTNLKNCCCAIKDYCKHPKQQ